ncbi:Bys1 family protein [Ophiocordyceps camponoti-floridani]|uniref:Bys1 family protein n=1 Tax=Ophiocordyceps camponoti-floridani TaxID=2030778 RepID=A0A8H4QD12_9HYPO|nr:Bys1 family protein [Ophiocordyceps camponoti-floridani]
MLFSTAVIGALVSLASAHASVKFQNNCPFDMDLWTLGKRTRSLGNGESSVIRLEQTPEGAYKYIKMTKSPDRTDKPHLQFSYSLHLASNDIVYGITPVLGGNWRGARVAVESSTCPHIVWPNGEPPLERSGNKHCHGIGHNFEVVVTC